MTNTELAIFVAIAGIIATLVSPCLAVQVQKWLEEARERKRRKFWIFATVMNTRATRTSPDHVMALNGIELAFNEDSVKDKAVVNAWRIYFDQLCNMPDEKEAPETLKAKQEVWGQKYDDLFVELLKCLSDALDYKFDKVQLKRGVYYPRAHSDAEIEQRVLRQSLLNLIYGKTSIPMEVTGFPADPEAFTLQQKLNTAILESISDGSLQVVIKPSQEK